MIKKRQKRLQLKTTILAELICYALTHSLTPLFSNVRTIERKNTTNI